jgi:hypothetical protein
MDLHVVIVAVPWRMESLRRVLASLERSSLLPTVVWVLLQDGHRDARFDDQSLACLKSRAFDLRTIRLPGNEGPAVRWRFIEKTIPSRSLVSVLDDDLIPNPRYLTLSVMPILNGQCDAVCWNGFDRRLGHIWIDRCLPSPRAMHVAGGGTLTVRPRFLSGLTSNPLHLDYFQLGAPDDAWASAVIRSNGGQIVRPMGLGPLRSTEAQMDSQALRWSSPQAFRMTMGLWALELTGWVPVDRKPRSA